MHLSPFSKRIEAVSLSPTIALNAKAAALRAAGRNVISFAVGEPDFPTPAPVIERARESLAAGRTKYGTAGGGASLRQAIAAKLMRENELRYSAEQIVVGMGAKELLFHAFLSLLNDGDEVLIPSPFWVSYADQVLAAGGRPVVIPVPNRFPESAFDLDAIAKFATDRTVAIVLNSPNNPAGYMYTDRELRSLGEYLRDKPWWILTDEIYQYLAFEHSHVSILNVFPEFEDRTLYFNGLSKAFAMTGFRVGYAAGPKAAIQHITNLQSHSSTCLPGFIEDAAIVAIEGGKISMMNEIAVLRGRRDLICELFLQYPILRFVKPQGAFYLFLDVREVLAEGARKGPKTSLELCEVLLSEYLVAAVPGEAFGTPGFLRLSYATSEANLREGITRILRCLGLIPG